MWFRLIFGFIFPPVVGSSIFWLPLILKNPAYIEGLLMAVAFGFAISGVQSFIYTLLMEFVVNRKIKTDKDAIRISALLGFLSGSIPMVIFGIVAPSHDDSISQMLELSIFCGFLGIMVGILLGKILRKHYKKHPKIIVLTD